MHQNTNSSHVDNRSSDSNHCLGDALSLGNRAKHVLEQRRNQLRVGQHRTRQYIGDVLPVLPLDPARDLPGFARQLTVCLDQSQQLFLRRRRRRRRNRSRTKYTWLGRNGRMNSRSLRQRRFRTITAISSWTYEMKHPYPQASGLYTVAYPCALDGESEMLMAH
jgi:hypothetical protein